MMLKVTRFKDAILTLRTQQKISLNQTTGFYIRFVEHDSLLIIRVHFQNRWYHRKNNELNDRSVDRYIHTCTHTNMKHEKIAYIAAFSS